MTSLATVLTMPEPPATSLRLVKGAPSPAVYAPVCPKPGPTPATTSSPTATTWRPTATNRTSRMDAKSLADLTKLTS